MFSESLAPCLVFCFCLLFYRGACRRCPPICSLTSSYIGDLSWVGESRALWRQGLALAPESVRLSVELPVNMSGRRVRTLAHGVHRRSVCGQVRFQGISSLPVSGSIRHRMPAFCLFVRKVAHLAVSAQSSIDFGGPVLQGAGAAFPGVAALVAGIGGQILATHWEGEVDILDTATFR